MSEYVVGVVMKMSP